MGEALPDIAVIAEALTAVMENARTAAPGRIEEVGD